MKVMTKILLAFCLIIGAMSVIGCANAPAVWQSDLDTALADAKKVKKDVFAVFSGSDWDGVSANLKINLLDTEDFMSKIGKSFVLLNVDFPEAEGVISPEQLEKNYVAAQQYLLQEFPTILLLSSDGDIFGKIVFDESMTTVDQFLEQIKQFDVVKKEREVLKAKITKAKGPDKLLLIDQLFEMTNPEYRTFLSPYLVDAATLDPDNTTALRGKYALQQAYTDAQALIMTGDGMSAASLFSNLAEGDLLSASEKQEALYMTSYIFAMTGMGDDAMIIEYLEKALAADPESANVEQIKNTIDQIKAAPAAPAATL